jgi:hypothetical protein
LEQRKKELDQGRKGSEAIFLINKSVDKFDAFSSRYATILSLTGTQALQRMPNSPTQAHPSFAYDCLLDDLLGWRLLDLFPR